MGWSRKIPRLLAASWAKRLKDSVSRFSKKPWLQGIKQKGEWYKMTLSAFFWIPHGHRGTCTHVCTYTHTYTCANRFKQKSIGLLVSKARKSSSALWSSVIKLKCASPFYLAGIISLSKHWSPNDISGHQNHESPSLSDVSEVKSARFYFRTTGYDFGNTANITNLPF